MNLLRMFMNDRNSFLKIWFILCMLLNTVLSQNLEDELTTCEIEALIRQLTNPSQEYQLHAAALRNQLRNLLNNERTDNLQFLDESSSDEDYSDSVAAEKRSLSSIARSGYYGKRYLGSLARPGGSRFRPDYDNIKRSLATLAKNGQLPSQEPEANESSQRWEEKRNLGALAKSGYLAGKRNIGSLARDYQLPVTNGGKRNLAALARMGFAPSTTPKRNMASLARMNMFPTNSYNKKREANYWEQVKSLPSGRLEKDVATAAEKKNLGALKGSPVHGQRQKRDIFSSGYLNEDGNYEIPELSYQSAPGLDYDDNMDRYYGGYSSYGDGDDLPFRQGKRFLGRILPPTRATSTTHRGRL